MDAATGLQPIFNHPAVGDRGRRRRGDADAFRRALREQDAAPAAAGEDEAAPDTPMRPQLQPAEAIGRREDGRRHVDVLA